MKRSRTWKDPQEKKTGLSSYFEYLFILNNVVKVPSIAASSYRRFTTFKIIFSILFKRQDHYNRQRKSG